MEIKEEVKVVRYIEFNGIRFHSDKRGYWIGHVPDRKGPVRLHRYVWEFYNGPVPDGYHVHHIDHNPDNNDISNLQLITSEEHFKYHANLQDRAWLRENMLTKAIPAAAAWHGSEEGRKWHSEHGKKAAQALIARKTTKVCQFCGEEYEVPEVFAESARFCSNNCKSAWRRKAGLDNIEIPCVICGAPILTNKYSPRRYCSPECRHFAKIKAVEIRELNRKRRRENVVSD